MSQNPVGKPPKWKNNAELEEACAGFFEWCDEGGYIPDIEGLCVYLETCRQRLFDYENKPEYADTIKKIKGIIAFEKKQLALRGKINPAVFCFDFKNNHGYKDKVEQKIEVIDENVNVDELKKEIRELVNEIGFSEKKSV